MEKNNINKKYVKHITLFYEENKLKIKLTEIGKEIVLPADEIEIELTNIEIIKEQLISSGKIQEFEDFLRGDFNPELHIDSSNKVTFVMSKTLKMSINIANDPEIIKYALMKDGRLSFQRCENMQIMCNLKVKNSGNSIRNFVMLEINLTVAQIDILNLITQLTNTYQNFKPQDLKFGDPTLRCSQAQLEHLIRRNRTDFENLTLIMSNEFRNCCRSLYQKGFSCDIDTFLKSRSSLTNTGAQGVDLSPTRDTPRGLPSQAGMYRKRNIQEDSNPQSNDTSKDNEFPK